MKIHPFRKKLSTKDIENFEKAVAGAVDAGQEEGAWKKVQAFMRSYKYQNKAALGLVRIVDNGYLTIDQGLEVLSKIYELYSNNIEIVSLIGSALEGASDTNHLNREAPEHPLFVDVIKNLESQLEAIKNTNEEALMLEGLATATRMMARQYDELAARCYRRLLEIDPDSSNYHYSYGLFCKTRGLFQEGWQANERGLDLLGESREAYVWNLGICATGAGEGEAALKMWKGIGNKIEMGRFDLPEGGYPQCKVRLAQRPLAERNSDNDDPGLEETVWIQRLSPCHGIIRSVLFQDLGVDYGDVILMDGAPITYHKYDDEEIPVFPHLATLVRQHYHFYNFAGTQEKASQISDLSKELDRDAIIYSHSENYRIICKECWNNPNVNHQHHDDEEEKHIITGRVAAPNDMTPAELLSQIDKAAQIAKECEIYIPGLCAAAGFQNRANIELRRFEMLKNN